MNIACLGAGNWGTTLAILLAEKRFSVRLWEYRKDLAEELAKQRENRLYLPGTRLPDSIVVTHQLGEALQDADMILLVVPCQVARSVCRQVAASPLRARFLVSAVKGIELKSLKRVSQIVAEELPAEISYGVLSGPSLANEVAKKHPASVVIASQYLETAQKMQEVFSTRFFRVYASADVIGVELAGALKNIIALAAGICDGLELGMNTKGALITRGLVEIAKLGETLGGKRVTFAGLSGMGDLITTCNSPISRNHRVGEALAKGRKLDEILDEMVMIAEGVPTAQAALELAQRHGIAMPITKAICQVLFEGKLPRQAVEELMLRKLKVED
ncbi:NAD(P)-dependent glycerol-3-phosphate dehydrogenase [bacterium]|nr:NAD(P)-dependent glycerol-3-phosphate dehydrogenase [bacterium]